MEADLYPQFFALEERHWWFRAMRALQWQLLRQVAEPPGRVLDVGCGTGRWLEELQAEFQADGCDLAGEALRFSRTRGIERLVQASALELPYRDGSYGLVTALGVLEHVDDDARMLRELFRVLRPGGRLLLLTSGHPALWSEHDELVHHKRRYRRPELRARVEQAGFRIERLTHANLALLPAAVGLRSVRFLLPRRSRAGSGSPDLFQPPWPLNQALYAILRLEAALLRAVDLPAGLGILALARRPGGARAGSADHNSSLPG
ncbi:MAG: class I SAM-dependent methyltransferase [Gemmatimonadetes bacterium]|nr:class I SAM-dependent methyltransferase [Gemmatimonadota bacterium]